MITAIVLVVAFLLGSLPWSLWVGRRHGVDLRQHGSGNLGATNVYRVLGWRLGLIVLVLDIAKGTTVVVLARLVGSGGGLPTLAAMAAVAGHMFTPFAGFKGGKGVATGFGVFLGLAPIAGAMVFLVWCATMAMSGWVSVASGIASLVLPVFVVWTRDDVGELFPWVLGLSILVTGLVLVRHEKNWRRLAEGTEQRIWEQRIETPEDGAHPVEEES